MDILIICASRTGIGATEMSQHPAIAVDAKPPSPKSEAPKRRGGRPKLASKSRRPSLRSGQGPPKGRLWQFLLQLLNDDQYSPSVIRWEDKENGVFCFVHGQRVAEMWGKLKGNGNMNYEKMTRTVR